MATLTLQSKGSTGGDTYIDSSLPNDNFGATSLLRVGIIGTVVDRGLLRFDLSGLPAGAVVSSALLTLYCTGEDSTADRAIAVTRALTQWYEGIKDQAVPAENGSTWAQRNDFFNVNWSGSVAGGQAGGDYVTPFSGGAVVITGITTPFTWTVTTDVQLWANGTANNGWWLIANSADTDSRKHFANFENGGANAPKLVITYTSSVVVAPTARFAVAGRAGPTVVKGSIAKTPTTRDAVGSTTGPTVLAGYQITPAPAEARGDDTGPTIEVGGLTFPGGNASARGDTVNPTVNKAADLDVSTTASAKGTTVGPSSVIKGSAILTPNPAEARGLTLGPASLVDLTLRPSPATAIATTVGKAVALRIYPEECTPDPILVLTDGTFRPNGQRNWLSLIRNGFMLNNWQPNIAQYKGGGVFSDSVLADGRRLVRRSFANAIEVMDMRGTGHSQNRMIDYIHELFSWQEAAADYWVSDWGSLPVYIIAKAAREANPRYAMIHTISVPELTNPYAQPFFTRDGKASLEAFTIRIERGPWLSSPPGLGECVPLSAKRNWTVQGWGQGNSSGSGFTPITGTVLSLIQTDSGDVLAGTNDQGWIYRSSDNGQHWVQLFKIGSGSDAVNAFAKTSSGALFAAVTGTVAARGIWKSVNNGVSWTKSLNDPTGQGYRDIAYSVQQGILTAGGGSDVGEVNNVTASPNEGGFWSIPLSHQSQYGVKAVAAQQEPVLATAYPNQPANDPFNISGAAFVGYDTYYTIAGVVYRNSQGVFDQYIPGSGQMGNRGLDMTVFLHNGGNGSFFRKALWAVKSAADTTDTEIWQWPNPAGGFNFGKLTTIDNKIFNVLYTDPVPWQSIPTQRTVWAGGNGEILVSYNNGLTWAVATTAPVNQVRALLRTAQGTLISGGDSGEIFIYTGDSGSQGGNTSMSPGIGGGTVVNSYSLGMEETCDDAVIASNKSTFSNITHVVHFNGSTFSELQFATVPPYELLGATAVVNKAVYFGSKTSDPNVPGGSFSNVIFEVTRIAENITVVWEYWNGSAWVALTVHDTSDGFRTAGVGSVHWVTPIIWATTAVNGVTGYWVRARISAVGTNPVTPVHDNEHTHRYIYTATLPYIEVSPSAVQGDLPAAAQIRWHNQSDDPGTAMDMEVDRILCGLRSTSRGTYFSAYINISDQQVPFGFTVSKDVDGVWTGPSLRAPTGRVLVMSYSSAGRLNAWNNLVTFSLANTVARDYYGTYRVFVRCYKYGAGLSNWQLRVKTSFGSGGSDSLTKAVFPTTAADWEVIDFGQITIPTSQVSFIHSNLGDSLTLTVQGYCTATGVGLTLYDLILIPTDEWAIDTRSPQASISDVAKVKGESYLDIDSITNPKTLITSTNRNSADQIVSNYQVVANGAAMLQTKQQQRLWFLVMSYENFWRGFPEVAGSVQAYKQQKYLAFRGEE